MSDRLYFDAHTNDQPNLYQHISQFIGKTVTIYTTAGGETGFGFTGVLLSVNQEFVSLVTNIGPAPNCSIGSPCYHTKQRPYTPSPFGRPRINPTQRHTPKSMNHHLGSITDIPLDKIVAFTHNAI